MTELADLLVALDQVPVDRLPEAIGHLETVKVWAQLTMPSVETRVPIGGRAALDVHAVARQAFLYEALVVEWPQDWTGERWEHVHANAARPRACQLKRDEEP